MALRMPSLDFFKDAGKSRNFPWCPGRTSSRCIWRRSDYVLNYAPGSITTSSSLQAAPLLLCLNSNVWRYGIVKKVMLGFFGTPTNLEPIPWLNSHIIGHRIPMRRIRLPRMNWYIFGRTCRSTGNILMVISDMTSSKCQNPSHRPKQNPMPPSFFTWKPLTIFWLELHITKYYGKKRITTWNTTKPYLKFHRRTHQSGKKRTKNRVANEYVVRKILQKWPPGTLLKLIILGHPQRFPIYLTLKVDEGKYIISRIRTMRHQRDYYKHDRSNDWRLERSFLANGERDNGVYILRRWNSWNWGIKLQKLLGVMYVYEDSQWDLKSSEDMKSAFDVVVPPVTRAHGRTHSLNDKKKRTWWSWIPRIHPNTWNVLLFLTIFKQVVQFRSSGDLPKMIWNKNIAITVESIANFLDSIYIGSF